MYLGLRFSTKSIVGTLERNSIGVAAMCSALSEALFLYNLIENVSQKIFKANIL
jgi:hypothetical protein